MNWVVFDAQVCAFNLTKECVMIKTEMSSFHQLQPHTRRHTKNVILNIQSEVGPFSSDRQAVGTMHTLDGLVGLTHVAGFALSAWSGPSSAIALWSLFCKGQALPASCIS